MKPEQAAKLRAAFPPELVGMLPKPTKKDNPKGACDVCGGYHGLPAVHLDYVGHAAVTDRLLQVDPEWTWEPMACGPNGEPILVNNGLWIRLTVCGVTRPGFGEAGTISPVKEAIGDAIRNAAMRFGVALDLWEKADLHAAVNGSEPAAAAPVPRSQAPAPAAPTPAARAQQAQARNTPPAANPPAAGGVFTFPSGKYVGKRLDEVPEDYLQWYESSGPRDDVKEAIRQWRADLAFVDSVPEEDIPFG